MRLTLLTILLIPSIAYAQLDKFKPEDIGPLTAIAQNWQQLHGLDLTAEQYEALSVETAKFRHLNSSSMMMLGNKRATDEDKTKFLNFIYEVLSEKQEKRLHQIFFQRFMNRDSLRIPLDAFAPGAIKNQDEKLSELQNKIDNYLAQILSNLPKLVSVGKSGFSFGWRLHFAFLF